MSLLFYSEIYKIESNKQSIKPPCWFTIHIPDVPKQLPNMKIKSEICSK